MGKRIRKDIQIEAKIGPNAKPSNFTDDGDSETPVFDAYSDDSDRPEQRMPEADEYDVDTFDKYLGAETALASGDSMLGGIVKGHKRDANGNPIGKLNSNPLLDTRLYEVEFPNGNIREYSANVIAESIYSQVDDDEGRHHLLMKSLVDHLKDDTAVPADDGYIVLNGNRWRKLTTKGWKLCVKWKDGSTSWEALKDLREPNPQWRLPNMPLVQSSFPSLLLHGGYHSPLRDTIGSLERSMHHDLQRRPTSSELQFLPPSKRPSRWTRKIEILPGGTQYRSR
jgi:hypothetical protein